MLYKRNREEATLLIFEKKDAGVARHARRMISVTTGVLVNGPGGAA